MAKGLSARLSGVQLAAGAATLHFAVALLSVLAVNHLPLLPFRGPWSFIRMPTWAHLVLVLGGTIAAAACAEALARERPAVAGRSTFRAHGAAAAFTAIASCVIAIRKYWHLLGRGDWDWHVFVHGYERAIVEEGVAFVVPQLILAAATALVFRSLTTLARDGPPVHAAPPRKPKDRRTWLALACYAVVYVAPATVLLWPLLARRGLDVDQILVWLIPVVTGCAAAAVVAEKIERAARFPLAVAFLSHAMAALAGFAITAAAAVLIDFRGSATSPMDYSYSLMRFAWFAGLLFAAFTVIQSVLGALSSRLFWSIARRLPNSAGLRSPRGATPSAPLS